MGVEIKAGLDNIIDAASDLTGTDTGFATTMVELAEALRSNNNDLGTAAKRSTGTTSGGVPLINASDKIETSLIDTATAGGSANASKVPLLNAAGQLASTMIPSASGGASGFRYLWKYDSTGPDGRPSSTGVSNRQYLYTWAPRDNSGTLLSISTILVFVTGGGGCGSYGPATSTARKGGGGAGGGTAIRIFTGITSASQYSIYVGQGGAARAHGENGSAHNGANSRFDNVTALGGGFGVATGAGGDSGTTSIDQLGFGVYISGGMGHDGTFDKFGGGSGGGTFWGGGYSGGDGLNSGSGRYAAPGAGGGGTHGHNGSTQAFTANRPGTRGNDGLVVVIGI